MSLQDEITQRSTHEIVHFTTNHGCLGTLYTGKLQSRARLFDDPMVQYLFSPNTSLRKDVAYLDYVNLSVCHINKHLFDISAESWHRDKPIFWCIMGFYPAIILHDGVEFATTNNMYTGVERGRGQDGFTRLFDQSITQWDGKTVHRRPALAQCYPTCAQAEVLYPGAVSTEHLERIYVRTANEQSEVVGFLKATFHRDVDVLIMPEKFGSRPL